ncbi:MAG: hypothetical protein J6S67_21045 [Methanobrevibacter sp.]|nr:hypothetical protein [Methanobrevibacter sp.]
MGSEATRFSSTNQPKNRKSRKGCRNYATELEYVYRKLFQKPVEVKDSKGNVIKTVKLTPQQEIIAAQFQMLRAKDVPANVKAKILSDMAPYLFKKEAEQIELNANVQGADISNLSTEDRLKAFRELMGIEEKPE